MTQVSLKNFRKYESLDSLELNGINIFVGKNNAGKSTVVKAIMLALDNLRSLRWRNVPEEEGMQSMKYAPVPYFRFDANGFHNLHIGTFERAKCNYIDDKRMTISLEYHGIGFEITVAGIMGEGQVSVPIEILKINFPGNCSYELNFSQKTMKFVQSEKVADTSEVSRTLESLKQTEITIDRLEKELNEAIAKGEALRVAEIQDSARKMRSMKASLEKDLATTSKNIDSREASFDLAYYHDHPGENILIQYLKTFSKIAEDTRIKSSGTGSMLNAAKDLKKNSKEFKLQQGMRQLVAENKAIIDLTAYTLELVLSGINVDYIQAHAAAQKLILNADDKQDINSRIVHEFYQENIQPGDKADQFLKKWLKEFEIGERIKVIPLDGEGYYVKVDTFDDEVHLADMGMGSIQLVILLLRLATIANRIETAKDSCWVIIEEPEQNIHPMLQSKLADLFIEFQKAFETLLIVETHSEYLIRRTQLLVAESGFDQEDIKTAWPVTVYYFPTERGRQPYDMQYQPNGMFVQKFDSGFFDEAGRIHMEILKRSRK